MAHHVTMRDGSKAPVQLGDYVRTDVNGRPLEVSRNFMSTYGGMVFRIVRNASGELVADRLHYA